MNIDSVIVQLRAFAPIFGGNVAGAADYATGVADNSYLPLPAAYVLHLPEDAETNQVMTSLVQNISERVAVVVVLETKRVGGVFDPADRRGQAASAYLDTVRAAIWRAILNWRPDWNPTDPAANREARGLYYVGANFPEAGAFDRARFFYQFNFGLDTLVTDDDGWQQPFDPLVSIGGTITTQDAAAVPVPSARYSIGAAMFVKPAPDPAREGHILVVLRPTTKRPLPAEGAEVPEDIYWLRRLAHGDVVKAEAPEVEAEKPAEAPEPKAVVDAEHPPAEAAEPVEHEPKDTV